MVAATSGQAYAEYIHANVLKPLGLESTTSEMPEAERGRRLATGYSAIMRDGTRKPLPFFLVRGIAPAAGYASTAEDLARFASWQFRLLDKGSREVLNANTLREMQRVHGVDPDFEKPWGLSFSDWRSDGRPSRARRLMSGLPYSPAAQAGRKIATIHGQCARCNSQSGPSGLTTLLARHQVGLEAARACDGIDSRNGSDSSVAARPDPQLAKYLESTNRLRRRDRRGALGHGLANVPPNEGAGEESHQAQESGEHIFRRIRKDDEKLAESIVFEMGADGRPVRILWNSNHYPRRP